MRDNRIRAKMSALVFVLVLCAAVGGRVLFATEGTTPPRPASSVVVQAEGDAFVYLPLIMRSETPPTSAPQPPPEGDDWLSYLNWLRAIASLPPLTENATWSAGCLNHSIYTVRNDEISHSEDPSRAWYTPEGDEAAQNSNVAVSSSTNYSAKDAMDRWMVGPFHGIAMIDPQLQQVGFGLHTEADGGWQGAATLDVLRGRGSIPESVTFPVLFPGNGKEMPYTRFNGGESPNPLSSCSGYEVPSGPPLMVQLETTPQVTAYSLSKDGVALDMCVFDETSYVGDNQNTARSILGMRHAVVLMPREPLTAGTYTASLTTNGQTHTWSFTVAAGTALNHNGRDVSR